MKYIDFDVKIFKFIFATLRFDPPLTAQASHRTETF